MIWTLLKLLFSKWLTIKRWNNFPRVENITPLDNIGFVIHTSLLLAHLEEKNWNTIDKEYIIKKTIFWLFNSLILSDINFWTREYISKIDSEIMWKIDEKVKKYLYSFEWWDFIKEDMEKIFSEKNKKIEDKIINVSKRFAAYNECKINAKVFEFAYDIPLKRINEFLLENSKNLKSLDELLNNNNYKAYLGHIRRLSHSMRWSWEQRNFPISVMSHLVITTFVSYTLWNLENLKLDNSKKYDIYNLMIKSIYHDIPEIITWDIITPIKSATPDFRDILEKVEEKMMNDYFFIYISDEYKKEISKYMLDPFSDKNWKLAKQADIISALLESRIERDSWNPNFNGMYTKIKKILNNSKYSSTNEFLKNILLDFWENIWWVDLGKY